MARRIRTRIIGVLVALAGAALLLRPGRDACTQSGPPTARAFLAEYHGDAWPALERAIEAEGLDLDRPYRFHPWESVAAHFEPAFELGMDELDAWIDAKVGWPDEPSVAWVEERYALGRDTGLGEDDLAFVSAAVADANLVLLEKASLWALTLRARVRELWRISAVARAPFTTAGLDTGTGTFTKSVAGFGWAITLTLRPEDNPDLAALEAELSDLAGRRDAIVLDLLAGVGAR